MEAFTQIGRMFEEIGRTYAEAGRTVLRSFGVLKALTRNDYTLTPPPAEPDPFADPYDPQDAEAWIRLWYAVNLKTGEPLEGDDHGRLGS